MRTLSKNGSFDLEKRKVKNRKNRDLGMTKYFGWQSDTVIWLMSYLSRNEKKNVKSIK